jgi:Relaxase/Mobilisation nuclease domain/Large polyvalent protein-associated domain 7
MIAKVTFGSGARGLARYVTAGRATGVVGYVTGDQHEIGATAYRNLTADTPTDAAREMVLTARLSAQCEKPFMHLSLSWHPSEKPEEPRMIEAMDRMLTRLGLEDRQAVYAVHREKAHAHLHAAVNRVGVAGTAWDRWQCKERISAQCRVLEREMRFAPIENYLRADEDRAHKPERSRTPREQRIYERSGIAPPARAGDAERDALRERIGADARTALRGAESWAQAHERLGEIGVALEAYAHPKTARTGLQLVEIATGERCAASAIGSDYGRRALEKHLGSFEPAQASAITREPARSVEATERARTAAEVGERTRGAEPAREPDRQARTREVASSGRSLWDEYADERTERGSERERASTAQRERDAERREALRTEHRVRRERVEKLGFPPALALALGSECAFAYASEREALDAVIAREREELREQYRAQSWTAYVVARAGVGDERAVAQLWQWAGQDRPGAEIGQALAQPEGREPTAPVVRSLPDLHARVDTRSGEVAYHWKHDGREAFRDRGGLVTVPPGQERDAMRSALRLAAAKWEGEVRVHGSEGFKRAAVEEAVKMGVRIINPEMRAYQEHVREQARERAELARQQERERAQERERGLSRGMGR